MCQTTWPFQESRYSVAKDGSVGGIAFYLMTVDKPSGAFGRACWKQRSRRHSSRGDVEDIIGERASQSYLSLPGKRMVYKCYGFKLLYAAAMNVGDGS
jgi:hypothetical protein